MSFKDKIKKTSYDVAVPIVNNAVALFNQRVIANQQTSVGVITDMFNGSANVKLGNGILVSGQLVGSRIRGVGSTVVYIGGVIF